MPEQILVTGGCGYIGSHTVRELQRQNFEVIVFDNLEHGYRAAVEDAAIVVGDLRRPEDVSAVFARFPHLAGVVHFAAYIDNSESMAKPGKYFSNNVLGTVNLLEAMIAAGVRTLVFSSTCGVYGTPDCMPIDETASLRPESPYAASKMMAEQAIGWYGRLKGLRSVALRYFNAAGASLDARIGNAHRPATQLLAVLMEHALGQRAEFVINGDDYPTPDGACIRDYIHVEDLATAHILALRYLWGGGESTTLNLGTGQGTSNKEMVNMVAAVTGRPLNIRVGPRRPGDLTASWADNTRARQVLGWTPRYGLTEIVESAWGWHRTHPFGYIEA